MTSCIKIILVFIFFFIPYTRLSFLGLKISELLVIVFLVLIIPMEFKNRQKNFPYLNQYVMGMIFSICIAGGLSYVDPIHDYVCGFEEGLYYSFEFGWIFRLARLLILYFFVIYLNTFCTKNLGIFKILLIAYIASCCILNIVFFNTHPFLDGRAVLVAKEPSEAGFINCFALILSLYLYLLEKKKKYLLSFVILLAGQIGVIGSTASFAALFLSFIFCSIIVCAHLYGFSIKYFIVYIFALTIILILLNIVNEKTHILDKIIYFDTYVDEEGSSIAERMVTIETCFSIFMERPIFGVGIGNFGWYLQHFVTSPLLRFVPCGSFQPNNMYAQMLAEQGIVGITVFVIFIKKLWRKIMYKLHIDALFSSFVMIMLVYILIHGLSLTPFFSFQFWIVIALVCIKIGNNAKIGAHALVLKDVEDGKTAVGLWK